MTVIGIYEFIVNGGFEDGLTPWTGTGTLSTDEAHSGLYSLLLPEQRPTRYYIQQSFMAISRSNVSAFGFWCKSTSITGFDTMLVQVQFSDLSWRGVQYTMGNVWEHVDILSLVWNPCTGEKLFPFGTSIVAVKFSGPLVFGDVFIDDVVLTPIGLTFDYVIDTLFPEESIISVPDWVNQNPELDTNVWSKKPLNPTYVLRVTDATKWALDQLLIAAAPVTLVDSIYVINDTYWISSINAKWEGDINYANPWLLEITLIKVT